MKKKLIYSWPIVLLVALVIILVIFLILNTKAPLLNNSPIQNDLNTSESNFVDNNSSDLNTIVEDINSQNKLSLPLLWPENDANAIQEIDSSVSLCLEKCETLRVSCAEEGLELKPDSTGCYSPTVEVLQSDGNCETNCFVK